MTARFASFFTGSTRLQQVEVEQVSCTCGGDWWRVRLNQDRLLAVLAVLNANTHLVKMVFTRGRKMNSVRRREKSIGRYVGKSNPTGLGRRV